MFTRHVFAAVVILAVVLVGPIILPGKAKIAADNPSYSDQVTTSDATNS